MAQLNSVNTFNNGNGDNNEGYKPMPAGIVEDNDDSSLNAGIKLDKHGNPYRFIELDFITKDGVRLNTGISACLNSAMDRQIYASADNKNRIQGLLSAIWEKAQELEPGQSRELKGEFRLRLVAAGKRTSSADDRAAVEKYKNEFGSEI